MSKVCPGKRKAQEPEDERGTEIEDPATRMMDVPIEEMSSPVTAVQSDPDAAMEEEQPQDEAMTLGQRILRISQSDPVMNRWAERG